jgi:hypothetical protein
VFVAVSVMSACATPRAAPRAAPVAPIASPAPAVSPAPETPAAEPALDPAEARASAKELIAAAQLSSLVNNDEARKRARELGLDETRARRLAEALAKPCLDAKDRKAKVCAETFDALASPSQPDETLEALLVYLGEIAEPTGYTPSMRLLVRLHAVGSIRAGMALEAVLARRLMSSTKTGTACSPPSEAELAASAASLADFAVVVESTPSRALRKPTSTELADLAYFYAAAVGSSGVVVASRGEDKNAARLPASAPDITPRAALANGMQSSLVAGDLAAHAKLARQYLGSLGYPGKIREAEESDQRWGGPAYSYVMRDLARSDELLGELAEAEALYRRANPGGGLCGTSVESVRTDQIQGVIRTAEEARGCRAVVAERLFSVSSDQATYGTTRLTAAGFDVTRLYRGALLTLGRRDVVALEQLFRADAQLGPAALARLQVRGQEAWAEQIRAIAGYAAEAKKAAIPELIALARRGLASDRAAAVDAIGRLLEDHGQDPCLGYGGWGSGGGREERKIHALSHACATKLPVPEVDAIVKVLAGFAADPQPELREAVADALGRTGKPSARASLQILAKDAYVIKGSQICTKASDGTDKCSPNQPVRHAAEAGLERLREAEARRVEERERARRNKNGNAR